MVSMTWLARSQVQEAILAAALSVLEVCKDAADQLTCHVSV